MSELQIMVKASPWKREDTNTGVYVSAESIDDKMEKLRNIAEIIFKDDYYIMETKDINTEAGFIRILAEKRQSRDVVAVVGENIYEEFKNVLEKKYDNQFVGIDVNEGKVVEIAKSPIELLKKLKRIGPHKRYYTRKIGKISMLV